MVQHTKNHVIHHINRLKESYNTLNRENAFDKIQHPFIIKTLKINMEITYLNIIKTINNKYIIKFGLLKMLKTKAHNIYTSDNYFKQPLVALQLRVPII